MFVHLRGSDTIVWEGVRVRGRLLDMSETMTHIDGVRRGALHVPILIAIYDARSNPAIIVSGGNFKARLRQHHPHHADQ